MKRFLPIVILVIIFTSCRTVELTQENVNISNSFKTYLFDNIVNIDQDQVYVIDENGKLMSGYLAAPFVCNNSKAQFSIPEQIQVKYDEGLDSYVFLLDEYHAEVEADHVSYEVHGYLLFDKEKMFTGLVAEDTFFSHENREIIFLVNDNPRWSDSEPFDYNYYSKSYRDKIEYDILYGKKFIGKNDLNRQFAAHDGYGMQMYGGESFLVYFSPEECQFKIEDIQDENDIIKNFKSMNVGRPFLSSYQKKIIVPLEIYQPDNEQKPGYLELITTHDQYINMKDIIENKKASYLVFRMGKFNDFSSSGHGILYFSYDKEQYDALMRAF